MYRTVGFDGENICIAQKYWSLRIKDIFTKNNPEMELEEIIEYNCKGQTETEYKLVFYNYYKDRANKQAKMLLNSIVKCFFLTTPVYLFPILTTYIDFILAKKPPKESQETGESASDKTAKSTLERARKAESSKEMDKLLEELRRTWDIDKKQDS
jgi:hypothetical protein